MSTETETKKITRKVYKNKGCVHVCWKGMCYQPPAGSGAIRGMTVEIVAEKGAASAEVYLPTDEGDEPTCEQWAAVDTHWRVQETKPTEPVDEDDVDNITKNIEDLCVPTEVEDEEDEEVNEEIA